MRYQGRKGGPLGRWIVEHLHALDQGVGYLDLFTGSAAVVEQLRPDRVRVACDRNAALITMHRAVQRGWLPDQVDRERYAALKARADADDPLYAFAMTACSFRGTWARGYDGTEGRRWARKNRRPGFVTARPAWQTGREALARTAPLIAGVHFYAVDYRDLRAPPPGVVVYADPPYAATTGYGGRAFDHAAFWSRMRAWRAAGVIVVVSEYTAPSDWTCVGAFLRGSRIHNTGSGRVERIFR